MKEEPLWLHEGRNRYQSLHHLKFQFWGRGANLWKTEGEQGERQSKACH